MCARCGHASGVDLFGELDTLENASPFAVCLKNGWGVYIDVEGWAGGCYDGWMECMEGERWREYRSGSKKQKEEEKTEQEKGRNANPPALLFVQPSPNPTICIYVQNISILYSLDTHV